MKKLVLAFCLAFISIGAFAQGVIPNGAFDSWAAGGVPGVYGGNGYGNENPVAWKTTNDTINVYVATGSSPFSGNGNVTKDSAVADANLLRLGPYSARFQTKKYHFTIPFTPAFDLITPAIAVSGTSARISVYPSLNIQGGYPFTERPDSLTGHIVLSPKLLAGDPVDTAKITCVLSKWNSTLNKRDTVAYSVRKWGNSTAVGFSMSSTQSFFFDTLHYLSHGHPDTCMIVVMSSIYLPGHDTTSYFYLDSLKFIGVNTDTGTVTPGAVHELASEPSVSVFPNPANAELNLVVENADHSTLHMVNILGEEVMEVRITNQRMKLNVSDLNRGVYIYRIVSDDGIPSRAQRLVICR